MACRRPFNQNNFIRFERVYGGLTLAELQAQGIAALCNPADIAPPFNLFGEAAFGDPYLTWEYEAGGFIDGFILYRNTTGINLEDSPYDVIADPAQRDYTDLVTVPGTIYFYMIKATNDGNLSAPSNIIQLTTLNPFIFEINNSLGSGNDFTLPFVDNVNLVLDADLYIDDVFVRTITNFSQRTITAAELGSVGLHTIALAGNFNNWGFFNLGDRAKFKDIIRFGSFVSGVGEQFRGCTNMVAELSATDTPNLIPLSIRFYMQCTNFNSDVNNYDFSQLTSLLSFLEQTSFNKPIPDWVTGNITDFRYLFKQTPFNQALNHLDVSNATTFVGMFNQSLFNQPLDNWDVANVVDFGIAGSGNGMFEASVFNHDISMWDTSSAVRMDRMFLNNAVFNQNIGLWDVGKVVSFSSMLSGANAFKQSLGTWDILTRTGRTTINMANMLNTTSTANGMTQTNYDDTLIGWAAQITVGDGIVKNVTCGSNNRRYTLGGAAEAALDDLVLEGWSFPGAVGVVP